MIASVWTSAIVGGVVGGITVILFALFQPARRCPECDTALPKFRRPQTAQQRMWGGWTCPGCGCDVDRHGKKREP